MNAQVKKRVAVAVAAGLVIAAGLGSAPWRAAAGEPTAAAPASAREMAQLAKEALGPDPDAAMKAVRGLKAVGDPAKVRLRGVVQQLLTRDRAQIISAGRRVPDQARIEAFLTQLTALRKQAIGNLMNVEAGQVAKSAPEARKYYDQLMAMMKQFNDIHGPRAGVIIAMRRRPELLELFQAAGGTDPKFIPAEEEKLKAKAVEALGMPLEKAMAIPAFSTGKKPVGLLEKHLYTYLACREIEAYNRQFVKDLHPAEHESIRIVNAYREALGLLPLEIDPRLVQSARRHSREMVVMKYFDHMSPVEEHRLPVARMQQAGYTKGYSENITQAPNASKAFWQHFGDYDHRNMVHDRSNAIGVGLWGNTWTQHYGNNDRRMQMDESQRDRGQVLGPILRPFGK